MKDKIVAISDFDFERFVQAILDFHEPLKSEYYKPSSYILKVDENGSAKWGPKKGWNTFSQALQKGKALYFPFSYTNCGEPIPTADGKEVELDQENCEIRMGDADTVGFLIKLQDSHYIIKSAEHGGEGCAPPHGDFVTAEDCFEFNKPMERFLKTFIKKKVHTRRL